jgi:2-desacetyl-2-hydroxyethyl bacteriochlorophyllide A dehydrogenase
VIGHEASAVVEKVGSGVTRFAPGDRVVVRPLDWCSDCPACNAGHSHICMNLKFMGIDSIGAFQEYWTVKERTLYKVPDNLSLKEAALIEPIAVACHDVRTSGLVKDEFALVMGGGPIGLLIAMVAKAAGARVMISEINEYRLEFARNCGFETVNPKTEDIVAKVNAATNGAGADVLFEVTASVPAAEIMTELVRTRGRIVAVGIYSQPVPVNLHKFFWRELQLFGARLYEAEDFDAALEVAASGNMPLEKIITGVYDLDDIEQAFASNTGSATALKTLIKCGNIEE